jgi:hypothetical protein
MLPGQHTGTAAPPFHPLNHGPKSVVGVLHSTVQFDTADCSFGELGQHLARRPHFLAFAAYLLVGQDRSRALRSVQR